MDQAASQYVMTSLVLYDAVAVVNWRESSWMHR